MEILKRKKEKGKEVVLASSVRENAGESILCVWIKEQPLTPDGLPTGAEKSSS